MNIVKAPKKAKRNAEYLGKLQRGIAALNADKGIEHEIIEDIDLKNTGT